MDQWYLLVYVKYLNQLFRRFERSTIGADGEVFILGHLANWNTNRFWLQPRLQRFFPYSFPPWFLLSSKIKRHKSRETTHDSEVKTKNPPVFPPSAVFGCFEWSDLCFFSCFFLCLSQLQLQRWGFGTRWRPAKVDCCEQPLLVDPAALETRS